MTCKYCEPELATPSRPELKEFDFEFTVTARVRGKTVAMSREEAAMDLCNNPDDYFDADVFDVRFEGINCTKLEEVDPK